MHRTQAILIALAWAVAAQAADPPASYSAAGRSALAHVSTAVDFGPRPAGSEAQKRQQGWIVEQLKASGAEVEVVEFTAFTPLGPKQMKNIIGKYPGTSSKTVVISGHYDTYRRPGITFVGANDGGSSTGLLLAMAELLRGRTLSDTVWLTFFDGEEAAVVWQGLDHTYGSRKQADAWQRSGVNREIKALINVDMIGDSDLSISYEGYSTRWLRDLIVNTAHHLGYVKEFQEGPEQYIADDHMEFIQHRVPSADLIDFEYGDGNQHWHQASDTVDKLSARSLAVVIHVLDETLKALAQRP
jgi:glutaminyl-peptide cyclotransferase